MGKRVSECERAVFAALALAPFAIVSMAALSIVIFVVVLCTYYICMYVLQLARIYTYIHIHHTSVYTNIHLYMYVCIFHVCTHHTHINIHSDALSIYKFFVVARQRAY